MLVGGHSHISQITGALAMNPEGPQALPHGYLTYTPQQQYTAVCLANN